MLAYSDAINIKLASLISCVADLECCQVGTTKSATGQCQTIVSTSDLGFALVSRDNPHHFIAQ